MSNYAVPNALRAISSASVVDPTRANIAVVQITSVRIFVGSVKMIQNHAVHGTSSDLRPFLLLRKVQRRAYLGAHVREIGG
jgi:hypothetical protein